MVTPTAPRPRLSALDAMVAAVNLTGRRLFPFRLEHWLPLGLVAFLDHCGRERGGIQFPNVPSSSSVGDTTGAGDGMPDISSAKTWLAEHLVIILAFAAAIFVFVVALVAIILWINSRGVFMYVDNVATGRFDVVRPWHEHAERAWSYFRWSFGAAMVAFLVVVLALVPIGYWVVQLIAHGAAAGPILGIVGVVLALIAFAFGMAVFKLLLRDFAAPLQIRLDVGAGEALGVAWTLARANVGAFLVYILLKIGFSIVSAILSLAVGCLTCCLGFLPVISQTLLQPLFYFERAWSLCLLQQAGWDLFSPEPPAVVAPVPPTAPPPSLPYGNDQIWGDRPSQA
jgi:hypothetical protein